MEEKSLEMGNYLVDQDEFLPWLARTVLLMKQKDLDAEKPRERQLAINYFKISGVDVS